MALSSLIIAYLFKENKKENSGVLLNLLGIILGVAPKLILKLGLSLQIIIFGLLLTSYYRSILSSNLTVPRKPPTIKTLQELAESGLQLLGPPSVSTYLSQTSQASPGDKTKATLSANFVSTLDDLTEILSKIAEEKNASYVRPEANLSYQVHKVN